VLCCVFMQSLAGGAGAGPRRNKLELLSAVMVGVTHKHNQLAVIAVRNECRHAGMQSPCDGRVPLSCVRALLEMLA
jgi:hypothetical protein